eukprot:g1015.t1
MQYDMFQVKRKKKRLEEDTSQLYELDESKFSVKFRDPLKRDAFELCVLPAEDTKNEKPLTFLVSAGSDYPNKPPTVSALNETDFPSGTNINKIRILEQDVWSITYNLACVVHSIRRRFVKRNVSSSVRRLFRDTKPCVLLGRGGFCERKGRRRTMEDQSVCMDRLPVPFYRQRKKRNPCFYAVYDGHGGQEAAKFAGRILHTFVARGLSEGLNGPDALNHAFRDTDEAFLMRVRGVKTKESVEGVEDNDKRDRTNRSDYSRLSGTMSLNSAILSDDDDMMDSTDPLRGSIAGTCASAVLVNHDRIYVANAGDSRVVLCRGGKPIALSRDHKPKCPDEIARIVEAGGFVSLGRTNGQLAVSRALGDCNFKGFDDENASPRHERELPTVSSEPEIFEIQICSEDEFLVIACDGLWDVMNNEEVVQFVRASKSDSMGMPTDLSRVASDLADHAIEDLNSKDNVSCIIVALESPDMIEKRQSLRDEKATSSPPVMSLNLELTNDDVTMSPKSSIDDLLEYASSPSHAKHFQNRKIPSSFNSDRGGIGLDDDDEDRFGKGMGGCSFSREEKKKKRKSGFRQRLGDLDDSTDLLDYLLDDSNFSPEQRKKKMEKD